MAIVGTSVIDPRDGGRVLANQTVLITHDHIVGGEPAGRMTIPPGTHVVDGRDRYVMAGLWDSHVHTLRLSPQLHLPLLIAYGVTSVRDMGDACSWSEALDCVPSARAWRAAVDSGTIVGPRVRSVEHDSSLLPQCSSTRWRFDGRVSSMAAVLDGFDEARCDAVLARLARHGTVYVPTHVASSGQDAHFASGRPGPGDEILNLVVRPHRWLWAVARRAGRLGDTGAALAQAVHRAALALTGRAHAAGVVVLAGSDALDPDVPHGSGLHDELAHLVRAGLTPAAALTAATVAPARHAGLLHERGTIEAGKVADLVVLTANPLEDIAHTRRIETVVAAGRVFDAARRQALVAGVRDAAASWASAARLLRGLWWDGQ